MPLQITRWTPSRVLTWPDSFTALITASILLISITALQASNAPASYSVAGVHLYSSSSQVLTILKKRAFKRIEINRVGCADDVLRSLKINPNNAVIAPKCVGAISAHDRRGNAVNVNFIEDFPAHHAHMIAWSISLRQAVPQDLDAAGVAKVYSTLLDRYGEPTARLENTLPINAFWCADDCRLAENSIGLYGVGLVGTFTTTLDARAQPAAFMRAVYNNAPYIELTLSDQRTATIRSNALITAQHTVIDSGLKVPY